MKTSFVTTIFNEEETIERLLNSLSCQTQLPDEVIIVDGGSTDNTVETIKRFAKSKKSKLKIILLEKQGNRSVGRNEGITKANGDIIVLSDAGCILERDFIEEIVKPFSDKSVEVVAGYYKGEAKTTFQKCLIPYVLVMPENVNPDTFLPATRSMAIRKSVWEEMGGFDEHYSHNEDYVFAKKLEKNKKNIKFEKNAIVRWIPRTTLKQAYTMFYRFALGDTEAGILRPKVMLIFLRYIVALLILLYFILNPSLIGFIVLVVLISLYELWAIVKNYRYVKLWRGIIWLPILQYLSDIAVIFGTIKGLLNNLYLRKRKYKMPS